ncbi:WD40-repeat-containing domain protein [Amylocystis lapponica]|nr:WD40-repeat-containing domain protein [Amylocystis lapponica]
MPLRYNLKFSLANEHSDAIHCVAISPDGAFVASGSADNRVVIWSLITGLPLHRLVTQSAALSLLWTNGPSKILCGTADGTLLTIKFDENTIVVAGFQAHSKAIDCLSMNSSLGALRHLASAAGDVVKLWTCLDDDMSWGHGDILGSPHDTSNSDVRPVVTSSVQWLHNLDPNCLITAYLNHGIVCYQWDPDHPQVLWSILLPRCGYCAVSPNNRSLAICTVSSGFEVYRIPAGLRIFKLTPDPNEDPEVILPIIYVHNGSMLLGGSITGKLRLWNASNGQHWQTLRLEESVTLQCVAGYYHEASDHFVIAAGASEHNTANSVFIWQTEEASN